MAIGSGRPRPPPLGLHRRDLDQDQHGPAAQLRIEGAAPARLRAARPLATQTFLGAQRCGELTGAMRLRWPDQQPILPCLCGAAARIDPQTRRHRHHGQSRQP